MNRQRIQKRVVIVGGGFSGLGLAIELRNRGRQDFVVLEKASQLGGTWRENTYPGCACDVPSQFYSYSYEPNADWSRFFAEQDEIQSYLLGVAEKHNLYPFIVLNAPVKHAEWDQTLRRWLVQTPDCTYEAQFLMGCQGPLHEPRYPDLPGLESFEGTIFHSAQWNHDHDLTDERVAVVGTGSSSIQFVPRIQPQVEHLTIYQRTAPWVLPKPDREVTPLEQQMFRRIPGFQKAFRRTVYGLSEVLQWAQRRPERMRAMEQLASWHLERQVTDPGLRERLRPSFSLGCKRLLLSNEWYPAIQAGNAELVSAGVRKINQRSIVGDDGVKRDVDTIIFATGFHVSDASLPEVVHGRYGKTLADTWAGSPNAYLGTTVHGFPNLFLMLGPNLGNGHGSAFVIIEAQAKYIMDAMQRMERHEIDCVEPRKSVQRRWNQQLQKALAPTVWNAGGCNSWYIDGTGINSSIYPWSTFDMRARMRRFDMRSFHTTYAPEKRAPQPTSIDLDGAVVAITGGAHGIGRATAAAFAAKGARVAIGDLDIAAAKRAASSLGDNVAAFELDVTSRPSFAAFVAATETQFGPIDVLVNNAGVMPSGSFLEESDELDAAVMAVNHWGTSLGMKLVLPGMVERGRGHVVNVASLAGKFAVPYLSSYAASKHATVGLSASVRAEVDGSGVSISTVMPTAVNTRLASGVPLDGLFAQEPEDVADIILRSCGSRAPEITAPEAAWPLVRLYNLLPSRAMAAIPRLLRAERILDAGVRKARAEYEAASLQQGRKRNGKPKLRAVAAAS